jgi:hypothetical protein
MKRKYGNYFRTAKIRILSQDSNKNHTVVDGNIKTEQ